MPMGVLTKIEVQSCVCVCVNRVDFISKATPLFLNIPKRGLDSEHTLKQVVRHVPFRDSLDTLCVSDTFIDLMSATVYRDKDGSVRHVVTTVTNKQNKHKQV